MSEGQTGQAVVSAGAGGGVGRLHIEWWPVDRVRPYDHNPRQNDQAVEQVARSLREFGWQQPIVVDTAGVIVVGHTRFKAALKLGMKEVPVHIAIELTPDQCRAYRIADNQTASIATWDMPLLQSEIADLKLADVDLGVLGFDEKELSSIENFIAPNAGQVDADEVPEAPTEPVTKPGDLWVLGNHRLLCGDSTKAADVARVMDGQRATCVFTDPPYGVSVGAKNRMLNTFQRAGRCLENIADDDLKPEDLRAALLPAFNLCRESVMADDCTLFVCAPQGGELGMMMMMMMQEARLRPRHVLIWKKNQPTFSMGRLDYDYAHEPILMTWGARHKRPMAGTFRTSVWEVDKPRACTEHPTMKPVELYLNAYANNSEAGDNVADIYAGSGPALIAAEQLGRRCFAIEISPQYVDVCVARWEKFTGKKVQRA